MRNTGVTESVPVVEFDFVTLQAHQRHFVAEEVVNLLLHDGDGVRGIILDRKAPASRYPDV